MAYSAKLLPNGNYEVYQDGARISTGSASVLVNYGLSTSNLGGTPTPTQTPTPTTTPTPTSSTTSTVTPPDTSNANDPQYQAYLKEQERIRLEKIRTDKIIADANALKASGAGSTSISSFVNNLAPADRTYVASIFPNAQTTQAGQTYVIKSGDTLSAIAKQFGVSISDISGYRSGNPNLIYPGETVTIGKAPITNTTTTTPTSTTPTSNTNGTKSIATQLADAKTEALRIQDEIAKLNTTANEDQSSTYMSIKDSLGNTVDESNSTKIINSILKSFEENNSKPSTPSLAETFAQQRAALGVGDLETKNSNIDAQIAKLDSDWKSTQDTETNRQVSVTQINRRKSSEQIAYEKARADLVNEKNSIVGQINQKYGVIDSIMKYTSADYENAQQNYQTQFSQAITLSNLIKGVEADAKSTQETKIDNARANLQIVLNTIKGKDYSTLDPATQADIRNMELQAGLPTGFTKFLSTAVSDPVVTIGSEFTDASGNRQVPVYTKNVDTGVVTAKVITLGTASTPSGDTAKNEANDIASAILDFQTQMKTKGWAGINPQAYEYYKSQIQKLYGSAAVLKFDKAISDAGLAVDNR